MSIDKLAPQSVEAEQSVLGSILIDAEAVLRVGDFLKAGAARRVGASRTRGDFYRQQPPDIYEAMLALHAQREPIDLVTLGDELARRERLGAGGGGGGAGGRAERGATC